MDSNDNEVEMSDVGSPAADNANDAPAPAAPSAPPAPDASQAPVAHPKILTGGQILDEWIKTPYFRHSYHRYEYSIDVKDFVTIPYHPSARGTRNWLRDDQLVIPLVLAAVDRQRGDMLVVNPFQGKTLANIGLGRETAGAFMHTHPDVYLRMRSEEVRWIVVPYNDVQLQNHMEGEDIDSAKEYEPIGTTKAAMKGISKSSAKPANKSTVDSTEGGDKRIKLGHIFQSHWGFMMVDKEESRASWLDGHLTIRRRGDVHSIHHMYRAGWNAGKILRGIDAVLERKPGQFAAATLMHVPHDSLNNQFKGDLGSACAPWVFAMFRYILDHPDLLTEANGLNGAFDVARKPGHVTNLAFHSQRTRLAMQSIIDDRVRARIQQQPFGVVPAIPTAPLIKMLNSGYHDFLFAVVTDFLDRTEPIESDEDVDDDDDDNDDIFVYKGKHYPKSMLREEISRSPGTYANLSTLRRYELVCESQLERQKHEDAAATAQNPHSRGWTTRVYPKNFDENNLPDFSNLTSDETGTWMKVYKSTLFLQNPRQGGSYMNYRPVLHRTYKGTFSTESLESLRRHTGDNNAFEKDEGSETWTKQRLEKRLNETYLTLETPLFAALTDEEINHWVQRLPPTALDLMRITGEEPTEGTIDYRRVRGLLHRMFIGELDEMSAEYIREWRQADSSINPATTPDNETAMVKMKILYEGPGRKNVPYLRESPLHWPYRKHRPARGEKRKRVDDDRERQDDDDANTEKWPKTAAGKTDKTAEFDDTPNANDKFGNGYTEGSKPTQDSKTAQELKAIDWLTITDEDLQLHIDDEVRNDERICGPPNNYTYRAILFLKHGGTFKNGTQSRRNRANLWVRDTNVFSHDIYEEEEDEEDPKEAAAEGEKQSKAKKPEKKKEKNLAPDLGLMRSGIFCIRVDATQILQRMAERYEPEAPAAIEEPDEMEVDTPNDKGASKKSPKKSGNKPSTSNASKGDSATKEAPTGKGTADSSKKSANATSASDAEKGDTATTNASTANKQDVAKSSNKSPNATSVNAPTDPNPTAPTAAPAPATAGSASAFTSDLHSVSFVWMKDADVDEWTANLPEDAATQARPGGGKKTGKWLRRAILQKLYGGPFETMSAADIDRWYRLDGKYRNKKCNWKLAQVVPDLIERTKETPDMDLRKPLEEYPKKYVDAWRKAQEARDEDGEEEDGKGKGKGKGKGTGKRTQEK